MIAEEISLLYNTTSCIGDYSQEDIDDNSIYFHLFLRCKLHFVNIKISLSRRLYKDNAITQIITLNTQFSSTCNNVLQSLEFLALSHSNTIQKFLLLRDR